MGQRALRFVRAGGDLAITVDATTAGAMANGLYAAAKDDPELAARVTASAARVLALKARLGLVHCG
jgi:beta-N-acetylhexosaminidase